MDTKGRDANAQGESSTSQVNNRNAQQELVKVKEKKQESKVQFIPDLASLSTNDSLDIQRAFSCQICYDAFTKEKKYPVSLNCGHSFCVVCIKKMNERKPSIMCGVCRKHTFSSHKRLGKNFLLIDILEKNGLLGMDKKKSSNGFNFHWKPTSGEEKKEERQEEEGEEEESDADDAEDFEDAFGSYSNDINTVSIPSDEMEEFYDQLENIQDLLHGFEQTQPCTEQYDRELETLRADMGDVVNRLQKNRRDFREIANRSRLLYQTVHQRDHQQHQLPPSNHQPSSSSAEQNGTDPQSWLRVLGGQRFVESFVREPDRRGSAAQRYFSNPVTQRGDYNYHFSLPTSDEDEESEWRNPTEFFLSMHFIRVLSRSPDQSNRIREITCYLCNANLFFSPTSLYQHVRGRRHQQLILQNNAPIDQINMRSIDHSLIWDDSDEDDEDTAGSVLQLSGEPNAVADSNGSARTRASSRFGERFRDQGGARNGHVAIDVTPFGDDDRRSTSPPRLTTSPRRRTSGIRRRHIFNNAARPRPVDRNNPFGLHSTVPSFGSSTTLTGQEPPVPNSNAAAGALNSEPFGPSGVNLQPPALVDAVADLTNLQSLLSRSLFRPCEVTSPSNQGPAAPTDHNYSSGNTTSSTSDTSNTTISSNEPKRDGAEEASGGPNPNGGYWTDVFGDGSSASSQWSQEPPKRQRRRSRNSNNSNSSGGAMTRGPPRGQRRGMPSNRSNPNNRASGSQINNTCTIWDVDDRVEGDERNEDRNNQLNPRPSDMLVPNDARNRQSSVTRGGGYQLNPLSRPAPRASNPHRFIPAPQRPFGNGDATGPSRRRPNNPHNQMNGQTSVGGGFGRGGRSYLPRNPRFQQSDWEY